MREIPDDPIIYSLEHYGIAPWHRDAKEPMCPICGMVCNIVYKADSEIVGCDCCLTPCDATDEDACFPDRGREW